MAEHTLADYAADALHHATRAHVLLDEADLELGQAGVASTVPPRAQQRVALAHAHAHTSLALSQLAWPTLAAAPPDTP